MIKFNKPQNLNGAELLDELAAVGIVLDKDLQSPLIDGNGDFWLDVAAKDKSKAEAVVAAHNGTIIAPDLTTQKQAILDRIGLTADEVKLLFG